MTAAYVKIAKSVRNADVVASYRQQMAEEIAAGLEVDDPAFDRVAFLAACKPAVEYYRYR
jgi:hypothetical protein